MDFLTKVAIGACVALVVAEVLGNIKSFTRWLVHSAATRLPEPLRERFIEEQYAELEAIQGPLSKLVNALGTYIAVAKMEKLWRAELLRNYSSRMYQEKIGLEILKAQEEAAFLKLEAEEEALRKLSIAYHHASRYIEGVPRLNDDDRSELCSIMHNILKNGGTEEDVFDEFELCIARKKS